ncbi:MAG: B12-binding domain-containing radical SAM protein [Gammaproteobacteria bacterium]|nr:B12-binding domain-containing radical SAM protein [Gammaproteobacteria bacterium]
MRITIIHPAIGHRIGEKYIRSWQMEPLPAALIAGLTPKEFEVKFYDDRMENIPYDEHTEAVVMSLETYTAKRAYQIASQYRKRQIPVIVGGFHASLMPDEAQRFAETVVIGEAEAIWATIMDDLRSGNLKKRYTGGRTTLAYTPVDRSIFRDKRYLPIKLIETGRGCKFPCDFCSIQSFFERTHRFRPVDSIISEILSLKDKAKIFFFVDDNFAGNIKAAKELLTALIPLNIRWITQMSINAAHDEEFLSLLARSGCKGVLIGFESLDEQNLKEMKKGFNTMKGGYSNALDKLRHHKIMVYGTFVFGFENDHSHSFASAVDFAIDKGFYIAAFNHLTPFPGTPMYSKLQKDGRLRFDAWWLDDRYRYNDIPFLPENLSPQELTQYCVEARRKFYSIGSILKRGIHPANRANAFMFRNFFPINLMHRTDVSSRNGYPLGDENCTEPLLEVL